MRFSVDDMKKYPVFATYLSVDIPEVQRIKPIIDAIKEFSGDVTRSTIKNALKWGRGPLIKVDENLQVDGEFVMGCKSQVIRISLKRVKDFENGMKGLTKKHFGRTKQGKLVYLVGVTLLHELTHWADDQDGGDNAVPGDPTNEEGWAFERKVYGHITEPFK